MSKKAEHNEPQRDIDARDRERLPLTIKGFVPDEPGKGASLKGPGTPVELTLVRVSAGLATYDGDIRETPDDVDSPVVRHTRIKLAIADVPGLKHATAPEKAEHKQHEADKREQAKHEPAALDEDRPRTIVETSK